MGTVNFSIVRQAGSDFVFAGPAPGSALTAIAIEILAASGIGNVMQIGTCGDLTGFRRIGDILRPVKSIALDGVTFAYAGAAAVFEPSNTHTVFFDDIDMGMPSTVACTDAILS